MGKHNFLILNQNVCFGHSKEPPQVQEGIAIFGPDFRKYGTTSMPNVALTQYVLKYGRHNIQSLYQRRSLPKNQCTQLWGRG